MNLFKQAIKGSIGLHSKIAQDVWGKPTGEVRCRTCGNTQEVNYADCLASGWPKCCGLTMTVDSSDEADKAI